MHLPLHYIDSIYFYIVVLHSVCKETKCSLSFISLIILCFSLFYLKSKHMFHCLNRWNIFTSVKVLVKHLISY